MNDNQTRALWAIALHQLADMINEGQVEPPTSAMFITQYVDSETLLQCADFSGPEPLKISIYDDGDLASTTIPTGAKLDLPITWIRQWSAREAGTAADANRAAFERHNLECLTEHLLPAPTE